MKFFLSFILCLVLFIQTYASNTNLNWQRKIINYERGEYKGGVQNWMVAQSQNDWMYFANSDGLLEFDGVNWALYPVRNSIVRSVKIIGDKIYIGGSTEFGYFESNKIGLLIYTSLSEKTKGWGGEVWNIVDSDEKIYFISDHNVHVYNKQNNNIQTIEFPEKIDCSGLFNNKLYLGTIDGIYYLSEKNKFELLPQSRSLKGYKFTNMCSYKDQLLISTSTKGLFFLNNSGKINPMQSIADDFIKNNIIFSVAVVGSKIALGSIQNGILIFDPELPSYKESINLKNGLKNNTILDCFFDKDQNLWLGLDKGIAYVNLKSPIRPLFATLSPIGTGYCSITYNGDFYLGTNQAVYRAKGDSFEPIQKTEGQVWSLNIIDGELFSSGDNGVAIISPTETYKINIQGAWETRPLFADKKRLIVGTYSGFCILEKINNRWSLLRKVPFFMASCRGFIEDEDNYSFWVTNTNSDIQRITFDRDFTKIIGEKKYEIKGATIKGNSVFRVIDNNLVICTDKGIFQYSRISDSFDKYNQLDTSLEGDKYYDYLFLDKYKNLWFIAEHQLKFKPFINGTYDRKYNFDLAGELIGSYENVFLKDSTTAIVAADNGFFKIDLSLEHKVSKKIRPFINTFSSTKNDRIICYGKSEIDIKLPYDLNSVKFDFAGTDYAHTSEILYTYKLAGIDKEWSVPTNSTIKEYTNLPPGDYAFELKAFINGSDIPNEAVIFSFSIDPPWYRSLFAYIVYGICLISAFYILYKKTISKQKKIIFQKGEELIAQSKKHEEETELKNKKIYELQNENLKNTIQHKTQEINGHLLNLIRKNEILAHIKKNALNISKAIDDGKQITFIRQKLMGLVSQIDANIENDDDFDLFQSNFDSIHHEFFTVLEQRFPQLNRNDKVLCVYLKMNLSSKEIAPLLNISIRGVEISRYRLRKKMNLDRNENLSEYLNNIR